MIRITSHVLDGENGNHAAGIPVVCYGLGADLRRTELFSVKADESGRISETVNHRDEWKTVELVFNSAAYREGKTGSAGSSPVHEIVVRLQLENPECTFHVPVILSAHSYSTWWSG